MRLGRVLVQSARQRRWYSDKRELGSIAEQIGAFLKESPVPTSRGERLFRMGGLAASIGIGAASQLLKRVSASPSSPHSLASSIWFSRENVERIVSSLTRMRGAALKLGQMVSMQDTQLFPPEFEEIFARVRDGANFMPAWQMEGVMRDELGADWRSKFAEFEETPFAAASIGQVHRAKIGDRQVAVKIQYPGVAKSIVSDLENLKALLLFSQLLPKGLFLENSIKVAQNELAWECDYQREAEYMKRFAALPQEYMKRFASLPQEDVKRFAALSPEGFAVPSVHDGASTGKVLTSDYLPGVPISALTEAPQELRDSIAKRIVWLCLQEIFNYRCMQTDPNWSNFLYDAATDKIVLLDFGSARDFAAQFVEDYAHVIEASARQDEAAIVEWSTKLGFLTGDETAAMRDAHTSAVLALGMPFAAPGPYDFSKATDKVTAKVRGLIPTMISYRLTPPPDESYSLHRKLSGVFLLCTRLRAQVDCHALLQDALSRLRV